MLLLAARHLVAHRHLTLAAVGRALLLARLGRAHDAALRIVPVGGLGDAIEIEFSRDLDAGMTGTNHRGDDGFDLLSQSPLVGGLTLVDVRRKTRDRIVAAAIGEQTARFVHNRHPLGLEPAHRAGDQMADRLDLLGLKPPAHRQNDRGGRFHFVAGEQRTLRQHQMHASRLHPVDRPDGAREFAFQRAQMIDVLNEARRPQAVRLVEDLVADPATLRDAGLRELHPDLRHPVSGHEQGRAVVLELVGSAVAFQLSDDARRVLKGQIGEQRGHLRCGDAHDNKSEHRHQRQSDGRHGSQSSRAKRFEELYKPLHRVRPWNQPLGKNCPVHGFHLVNFR